jgi:centrosomal protein CEP135
LSNLNRNLQRHEESLKKYQIENNEIMQELMHSRDINGRFEMAKEELTRHLTSKELDNEQLQNLLADLKAESDLLKSQINSERTMVKNLEDLISNNREKEFHTQLSSQEREAEISLLKDKIGLNEQKLYALCFSCNILKFLKILFFYKTISK